ncbi:YggL family protein [Rheinheimera sp.]|uniref:YggL 50S ribosome-binding family protein n=1 Tax=Rheinheimera sp. TaxID=1869214 RepID=UPI0027BA098C|nr:YggL family protein [Rheinheimera sp.]
MSHRSRRLQKKLYLGEFAVLGFEFSAEMNFTSDHEFEGFLDNMIDFIESRELVMAAGGTASSWSGVICSIHRYGCATTEDQQAVEAWLSANSQLTNIRVGPLLDVNYGL